MSVMSWRRSPLAARHRALGSDLEDWNGTGWTSVGSAVAFSVVLTQSTSSVATSITYTPTGTQPALPSSATFVVNSAPATAAATFTAGA